jgi:WD40 repeat protein
VPQLFATALEFAAHLALFAESSKAAKLCCGQVSGATDTRNRASPTDRVAPSGGSRVYHRVLSNHKGCIPVLAAVAWALSTKYVAADMIVAGSDRVIPVVQPERPDQAVVVTAVELSPDGTLMAAAGDDHRVRILDVATGKALHVLEGHTDWVRAVAFSPDGKWLASAGNDRRMSLWDASTGRLVRQSGVSDGALASLVFHPQGTQIAAAGFQRTVNIYDAATCDSVGSWGCPCNDIRCAAFSPDGRLLAVAGRNGKIRIMDACDGTKLHEILSGDISIRAVAFSPSGQLLAVGGDRANINVWDSSTGELRVQLAARPAKIRSLAFLAEDELVAGGTDNCVTVWSVSERTPIARFEGHTGTVAALAVNRASRTIVSAGYDTTLRVWRLDSPEARDAVVVTQP